MKKLFPLVLLLCVIGAWASVLSRNVGKPKEYGTYLEQAAAACEKEYYVEAMSWLKRIDGTLEPEQAYEANRLQRDIYAGLGEEEAYIAQCLHMTEAYPEAEANYLYVIRYYQAEENLEALYQYVPAYLEKWPENEELKKLAAELDKSYDYIPVGYYDVKYATGSLIDVQVNLPEETEEGQRTKRRLCQSRGNEVFDYGYSAMQVSKDGSSCLVQDENGAWKLVDIANRLLAKNEELSFDSLGSLGENGIATAKKDGKCFFVNRELRRAEPEWDDAATFSEGINAVCRDGKWALVTTDSWTEVAEYPYSDVARNSYDLCAVEGICVVADGQGYYLLDAQSGEAISENRYEELKAFESAQPTAYRSGDKWGFVNRSGNVYLEAVYEDALPYRNGYAAVKQNGLWGYIDSEGSMVIETQFAQALPVMADGVAYVQNELGYWDYIVLRKLYYAQRG